MIRKIESFLGKDLKDIEMSDIENILSNEDIMNILKDPNTALKVSDYIIKKCTDEDVKKQFIPLFYRSELILTETELGSLFKNIEDENERENILEKLQDYMKSNANNFVKYLSSVLISLMALPENELKDNIVDIKKSTNDLLSVVYQLDIATTLDLICDFIDLIDNIRQEYYNRYEEDIIEDIDSLKEYMNTLDAFMQPLFEEELKRMEELTKGISPEEIGCLDITKLNKE